MHAIIGTSIGRIHHAAANPAVAKTRPIYCWVPEEYFGETGLQRSRYLTSRWPSINCTANPVPVGTHVIPDSGKPADLRSRCPVLAEFLRRLESCAAGKTHAAAA